MAGTGGIGCYPGSFNPPTVAHLAVAEAAVRQGRLVRLDLVISRVALGKEDLSVPTLDDRVGVLEQIAAGRPWLGVAVTDARLIVEIARGYDAVVMGADKWRQVIDPVWYPDGETGRDRAVADLPRVLVAARGGDHPSGVELLELDGDHHDISASAIRRGDAGTDGWLLPEAATFDAETGAWTDPGRYRPGAGR